MPAVQCRRVTKDFGSGENRIRVLKGVDLDAAPGEMTVIAGPSGCGKSTLLSVITGLLNASSGEVMVLGKNLRALSGTESVLFRRREVGMLSQQFSLLPALTVVENAALPLLAAKMPRREALARASEMLNLLGLGDRLRTAPGILSVGQQQRVALARALVHEPRLIVCDEPTSALDGHTGHAVMEMLAGIALNPDRAIIVVTHDERVFSFADRIVHMKDGVIGQAAEPALHIDQGSTC